jgi:hypothetical protein
VGRKSHASEGLYLPYLTLIRARVNADIAERRAEAKRRGEKFSTQDALNQVAPKLRMTVEALRVLLSKKANKEKVHRILERWAEAEGDPRFADGADPFMGQ